MNGAHDMGGMHGYGAIEPEPEAEEPVFHCDWEKRVFGLTLAAAFLGEWNADMSRHARERQQPADYLQNSYYENWLAGLEKLLLEKGLVTAGELATGRAAGAGDEEIRRRILKSERVSEMLDKGGPVSREIDGAPRFHPGDRIRAVNQHPQGHTRQPRYVRGCPGVIREHHGAHVFPDRSAEGVREAGHLYNVRFEAADLWGNGVGSSAVYVDLWEGHLEPA